MKNPLALPRARRAALAVIARRLQAAHAIMLTTHVNADGDGTGSQAALGSWLAEQGKQVWIVNPTPFPPQFRHLVPTGIEVLDPAAAGAAQLARADVLAVLDTAEAARIGRVARYANGRDVVILDHHVHTGSELSGTIVQDITACATGELIYDLLTVATAPRPWSPPIVEGIYTAIVTDTGSFRFANTTPRAHAIAGDLIAQGLDPEQVYCRIFATVPRRRLELLRHALGRLEVDPRYPITWVTIDRDVMRRLGTSSDDLDGIVEHARSVAGTEVAILFRETADGATKVSLRSAGELDVNAIARQFGGGGHVKAAGALIGEPPATAVARVLDATRAALQAVGLDFRAAPDPV